MQQTSNPYFVAPMDLSEGLKGLSENFGEMVEKRRKNNIRQKAMEFFKAGDLDSFSDIVIKYPWLQNDIKAMTGATDDLQNRKMSEIAKFGLIGDLQPLYNHISYLNENKKLATPYIKMAQAAIENPDEFKKSMKQMLALFDQKAYKELSGGGWRKGITRMVENPDGTMSYVTQLTNKAGDVKTVESDLPENVEVLDTRGQTSSERLGEKLVEQGVQSQINISEEKLKGDIKLENFKKQLDYEIDNQALKEAEKLRGKFNQEKINTYVDEGFQAAKLMPDIRRGLTLLKNVKTGGWRNIRRSAQEFFDIGDVADEGELALILSRNVLTKLTEVLGSQFTERENRDLQRIYEGFKRSTSVNIRLLTRAFKHAERAAQRAAILSGNPTLANEILNDSTFEYEYDPDWSMKPASEEGIPQAPQNQPIEPQTQQQPKEKLTEEQFKKDMDILLKGTQ